MSVVVFLVFAIGLVTPMVRLVSSAETCDLEGGHTLESSEACQAYCDTYQPCVILDGATDSCGVSSTGKLSSTSSSSSSSGSGNSDINKCFIEDDTTDSDGSCAYSCVYYSGSVFSVFVAFGSFQSEEEIAAREIDNESYSSDVELIGSGYTTAYTLSDDSLDSIGSLELQPYTYSVVVAGGGVTYLSSSSVKSKVVNVTLSTPFLANQTQVTSVEVNGLNLKNQIDELPSLLPSTTAYLRLLNNLIYDFPWSLDDALLDLNSLYLTDNYISNVTSPASTAKFESLQYLYLDNNNITTFDAKLPNLIELTLSENMLTEFPVGVGEAMTSLTILGLDYNDITVVDASVNSDSITSLSIQYNQLSTFNGSFPNLQSLYMNDNNLTAIPEAIFEMNQLTSLSLDNNPLSLNMTRSQFQFLSNIDSLTLSLDFAPNATWDCEIEDLGGIAVCITDAVGTSGNSSSAASDSETAGSSTGAIVGGVIAGAVLVTLLVALFLLQDRRRYAKYSSASGNRTGTEPAMNEGMKGGMQVFSLPMLLNSELQSLQLNPADVEDLQYIGEDSLSVYWIVRYRRDTLLVSKQLRPHAATRENIVAGIREAKLASMLQHPCLVSFVGVTWPLDETDEQSAGRMRLLYEYVGEFSLRQYLLNETTARAWTSEKLQIAIDVADAIVYLHSLIPPVIHGGIRSHNILLTHDFHGKLGGYQQAKLHEETAVQKKMNTADKILMPPEILASSLDSGEAADIYRFGLLLLEIDSHALPFEENNMRRQPDSVGQLDERTTLQLIVAGEVQAKFQLQAPQGLVDIGLSCLNRNPWVRPRAAEVAYQLRQVLKGFATT